MEADDKPSLITNNLHLTQCTSGADYENSVITNNLHLTQWTMEADYKYH